MHRYNSVLYDVEGNSNPRGYLQKGFFHGFSFLRELNL